MKMTTAMLTVTLLLAAGRAKAQNADGAIDAPPRDAGATQDAGTDAKGASHDASVGVGGAGGGTGAGGTKGGAPTDAGPPPTIHFFANDNPGCSFGGAPGPGGPTLVGAGLIALAIGARRRRAP
jgi:MYXO-CTERM domain-containing protein